MGIGFCCLVTCLKDFLFDLCCSFLISSDRFVDLSPNSVDTMLKVRSFHLKISVLIS